MAPLPRGLCALLILWLASSRPSAASRSESSNSPEWWGAEDFSYIKKSAERSRRDGDYPALEKIYRHGIEEARRLRAPHAQISYWTALGNTYVFLYRYAEAVEAYGQARELAKAIGDWAAAGAIAPGLSSIYLMVGDRSAALEAFEGGLDAVRRSGSHPYYEAQLELQYVRLNAGSASTLAMIGDAIEAARIQNNLALETQAWDLLGQEYIRMGRFESAEDALDQSYRLRLLHNSPDLRLSYFWLGSLRLAQHRLPEAKLLTEKAIAANASAGASLSSGPSFHQRGLIREAEGHNDLALSDFEMATGSAEKWRSVVPAEQSARTSADIQLDREVFRSFIGSAARRALDSGDRGWASKAFLAMERNRAYSLQPLPSYSPGVGKSLDKLESFPIGITLNDFQRGLRDSELVLSFYTEAKESYLWAVTRETLHLYRLPSAGRIAQAVEQFQKSIIQHDVKRGGVFSDKRDAVLGRDAELYTTLFGQLSPLESSRSAWILSLDGPLFDLPFAALRTNSAESGRYLVELHSLQTTPSAAFLHPAPTFGAVASQFLGVGDAIYNSADERITVRSNVNGSGQLNRLIASGEEISRTSGLWPGQVKLLSGPTATRLGFLEALAGKPATIHLATHVVTAQGGAQAFLSEEVTAQRAQASIAFSLGKNGQPELLSTPEVATLHVKDALIVMTGCSSGTGDVRPGAGLLGLTRAWLTAGASAVLATGWPVEDTRGDLLPIFYRQLASASTAEALRKGQVEMIHSGTWQSDPAYWAAFQLTGGAR